MANYYDNQNGNYTNATYQAQPTQYRQPVQTQYVPQPQQTGGKSGGLNLPTVLVSIAAAAVIGLTGGWIGSRLGGGSQTIVVSGSDAAHASYIQTINRTSNESSQSAYSVVDVAEAVADTVVEIRTEIVQNNRFMGQYVSEGAGSGVIFTEDGYIMTNHHVIEGARSITVKLRDGTEYTATLVGDDSQNDLALIKVQATGLHAAVLHPDSDALRVGQTAIAIGNPLGELGGTVTSGIVSAKGREIDIDGQTMTLLQTSAAINPGNSGGGLFDDSGNLIGIVNAKSSGSGIEGLGFAIPINTVKLVYQEFQTHKNDTSDNNSSSKNGVSLGITAIYYDTWSALFQGLSEAGVYVASVESGSPAANAGLEVGDMIESFNGAKIDSTATLIKQIEKCKKGDSVPIVIHRNGTAYQGTVTF